MRPPRKIVVLLGVLAAVAMWIIEDVRTIVFPSPNEPSPTAHNFGDATSASGSSIRPQLPAREPLPRTERDPLSARSWATPSPSAFVSAPPQVPVAPPLPYRFVGEIVLPTETWAFLARGDAVFQVREGGTIGGEYKVESVKADELVLLHLASGVRQVARSASPGGETRGPARKPCKQRTIPSRPLPGRTRGVSLQLTTLRLLRKSRRRGYVGRTGFAGRLRARTSAGKLGHGCNARSLVSPEYRCDS